MRQRGFTLIEVLVSIAIVTVLLALAAGMLRGAQSASRQTVSLSNLRTHAQTFAAYNNDYSDAFPYFTKPGFATTTLSGGSLVLEGVSYFDAHRTWHIALADAYYGGRVGSKVFRPPGHEMALAHTWPIHTPYLYGCVFITSSKFWNERTRIGPEQFRGTKASSVLFPSSKTLITESWPFEELIAEPGGAVRAKLPVALTDGSSRRLKPVERKNGYWKGEGWDLTSAGAVHFSDKPPLLHTIDGVRGRDVR